MSGRVTPDQSLLSRQLADLPRTGGWLPTGAIDQTIPDRLGISSTMTLTSGTLNLVGGVVIPGGRAVSSISYFSGNIAAASVTAQWFALYDKTTLALLATTVDDGATAWGTGSVKTLQLATALRGATPGGTWTPTNDQEVYLGICVNGTTPPNLRAIAGINAANAIAPAIVGTSTTGIASGVANAPDPAGAITGTAGIPWAWVS